MKKLILTSPKFEGEIELVYDSDNILILLDMRQADLTPMQSAYMKNVTPVLYEADTFKSHYKAESLVVLELKYEVTFEVFWNKYELKRNKERCIKLWGKLSEANKVRAYNGLNSYFRHLANNKWKTKADPETYLSKKYWENDWK